MPRTVVDPQELELRRQLMRAIRQELKNREMKGLEAAELLGIKPPDVTYMIKEQVERVSLGTLLSRARKLGLNFTLELKPVPSQ